jgi:hypothetical protein
MDHDGYLPTYAYISNGKKHDVTIAYKVPLSTYLMGKVSAFDPCAVTMGKKRIDTQLMSASGFSPRQ